MDHPGRYAAACVRCSCSRACTAGGWLRCHPLGKFIHNSWPHGARYSRLRLPRVEASWPPPPERRRRRHSRCRTAAGFCWLLAAADRAAGGPEPDCCWWVRQHQGCGKCGLLRCEWRPVPCPASRGAAGPAADPEMPQPRGSGRPRVQQQRNRNTNICLSSRQGPAASPYPVARLCPLASCGP